MLCVEGGQPCHRCGRPIDRFAAATAVRMQIDQPWRDGQSACINAAAASWNRYVLFRTNNDDLFAPHQHNAVRDRVEGRQDALGDDRDHTCTVSCRSITGWPVRTDS